ncbi:MAG TPA: group I intron-associated PD-(D/E)XK endonuclease [Candidatus Saccharimonadales bacterium]|nr:group I intron-associated PD-(D/E)XK endonuclease [Candidatus Saccharimonadales bacterium]
MLSKQKGDLALGQAIAYFIGKGYEVCLPIGDKRDYDLVVEKRGKLARVQVKYGGLYRNEKSCIVALRVMGGNQSFFSAKKYPDDAFEYLFVHTAKNESYLLPWNTDVIGKSTLCIESKKYIKYRVALQG